MIMLMQVGLDRSRVVPYLAGIDKFKFRRPVLPGDQLVIEMELLSAKHRLGRVKGTAKVDGKVVAEGEIMYVLAEDKGE